MSSARWSMASAFRTGEGAAGSEAAGVVKCRTSAAAQASPQPTTSQRGGARRGWGGALGKRESISSRHAGGSGWS